MGHGGARPGAGVKPGTKWEKTLGREAEKEMLRELLRPHKEAVANALINKALTGDVQAVKEFNERLLGKVTEEVDHTSGGEKLEVLGINYLAPTYGDNLETDVETTPDV